MNTRYLILLFIAVIAGLSACKNNDNVFPTVVNTTINVVNASADTLNFFLNGTRQNNASNLFPLGSTLYLTVPAGAQNYQFKKADGFNVLFSVPLTLSGVNNSLYVAGESAADTFSTRDTLTYDSGYTSVRFVNAAPNAGNLNVFVGDTVNFKSRAFKSSSVFLTTGSGLKEVKIYLAGATTAAIDTIIAMEPNSGYTLFAKGQLNGKGNAAFDVGVVTNFLNQ